MPNIQRAVWGMTWLYGAIAFPQVLPSLALQPPPLYAQTSAQPQPLLADLLVEGNRARQAGRLREARDLFTQAIDLYPEAATPYNNLGLIFVELEQYDQAIASYEQAIAKDPTLAIAYQNLAQAQRLRNDPPGAIAAIYDRAFRAIMDSESRDPTIYLNLGRLMNDGARWAQAVDAFQRSIELNPDLAATYNNLGMALAELDRGDESEAAFQTAIQLAQQPGIRHSPQVLSIACDNLSDLFRQRQSADTLPDACTEGTLSQDDPQFHAQRGLRLRQQGDLRGAIESYNRALELDPALAIAYNNRGVALAELGARADLERNSTEAQRLYEAAVADYRRALELAPSVNGSINLGNALQALGRIDEAVDAYLSIEEVLDVVETLPESVNNPALLETLAIKQRGFASVVDRAYQLAEKQTYYSLYIDVLMELHRRDPAAGFDRRALQVSERARSRSLLETLTEADAYQQIGDPALATQERQLRTNLSQLTQQWTDLVANLGATPAPMDSGDSIQSQNRGDRPFNRVARSGLMAIASPPYATKQADTEADPSAESACTLNPSIDATAPTLEQQITQLEQSLRCLQENYTLLLDQIRQQDPDYARITQAGVLSLSEIQEQVIDDDTLLLEYWLGETQSYLWVISKPSRFSPTGLQTYILPPRSVIEPEAQRFYEYLTASSRRQRTAQMMRQGQRLSQIILGPIAPILDEQRLLIVADGELHYTPFSALPRPLEPEDLADQEENEFPDPLIKEHEIVHLPSASVLAAVRRETAIALPNPEASDLLIVADPVFDAQDERFPQADAALDPTTGDNADPARGDGIESPSVPSTSSTSSTPSAQSQLQKWRFARLPGTSIEATGIIDLAEDEEYDYRVLSGFEASRALVYQEARRYRIIHFATHGVLDDQNPAGSGMVLAQINPQGEVQGLEGFLSMPDVFRLNLAAADLVVLSGCQTGLGTNLRGEGLLGLTQAFTYAGAERAVVSLWSVDDEATAILMERFYRELLDEDGEASPSFALAEAQRYLREVDEGRWSSPYYWAAFVLQGDWQPIR